MHCPTCGGSTQVTSRKIQVTIRNETKVITRRRRRCLNCQSRATTFEIWAHNLPTVRPLQSDCSHQDR